MPREDRVMPDQPDGGGARCSEALPVQRPCLLVLIFALLVLALLAGVLQGDVLETYLNGSTL